jgi:hypothetical protein
MQYSRDFFHYLSNKYLLENFLKSLKWKFELEMRESKAPIVIPSLLWHNHGGNFLFKVPYHTIGAGMAKKCIYDSRERAEVVKHRSMLQSDSRQNMK